MNTEMLKALYSSPPKFSEDTSFNSKHCPYCGASLKKYWHKITPVLASALSKIYKKVSEKGNYKFTMKELDLSHSEFGNFQKLRFHGLIAKDKTNSKTWILTSKGRDFICGKIRIPRKIQTFRNKVVGHSTDTCTLAQVLKEEYVQVNYDFDLFKINP